MFNPSQLVSGGQGLLTVGILLALSFPPLDYVFTQNAGHVLGLLDRSIRVGARGLERRLLPELVADLDLRRGEDGGIACNNVSTREFRPGHAEEEGGSHLERRCARRA